jgi:hypothetical protein
MNILSEHLFLYNSKYNMSKGTGFKEYMKQRPLPEGIKTNSLIDDQQTLIH